MKSKQIGFGELTANRCIIYDERYLKKILSGEITIDNIKPIRVLNFDDDDAIPFEIISLKMPNHENYKNFYIGNKGDAHSSLINQAFKESPVQISNLPSDWRNNGQLNDIVKSMQFSYGGRIWIKSKILILKSYEKFEQTVSIIKDLLNSRNIDITQYVILYCKKNENIDERYWGDIVAYKVSEICSKIGHLTSPIESNQLHHKYEVKTKKLLSKNSKEEMTLAQYRSLIQQESEQSLYHKIINEVAKVVKKHIDDAF